MESDLDENDARFGGLCRPERGFQKKLAPSAAVIKQGHVVNQKRVVTSAGRPDERLPNPAWPFDKSEAVFFHIRSNTRSDLVGLGQILLDRDDLTPAASLERSDAVVLIEQEILERSQQERAKPALLLIRAGQSVLLK